MKPKLELKRIKVGMPLTSPKAIQMVKETKQAVTILEAAQRELLTKLKETK